MQSGRQAGARHVRSSLSEVPRCKEVDGADKIKRPAKPLFPFSTGSTVSGLAGRFLRRFCSAVPALCRAEVESEVGGCIGSAGSCIRSWSGVGAGWCRSVVAHFCARMCSARLYEPRLKTLAYPSPLSCLTAMALRPPLKQCNSSGWFLSGTFCRTVALSSPSGMLMAPGRWPEVNSRAVRTSTTNAPEARFFRAVSGETNESHFSP